MHLQQLKGALILVCERGLPFVKVGSIRNGYAVKNGILKAKAEGLDFRAEQTLFCAPALRGHLIATLDGDFTGVTMIEF